MTESLHETLGNHFATIFNISTKENSLPRLRAQTLPNATPPIGKIHIYSNIAVPLKSICNFDVLCDLESPKTL